MIEGGKAIAGEIDNLEHDWRILSQGREEADHKNKRRSEGGRDAKGMIFNFECLILDWRRAPGEGGGGFDGRADGLHWPIERFKFERLSDSIGPDAGRGATGGRV